MATGGVKTAGATGEVAAFRARSEWCRACASRGHSRSIREQDRAFIVEAIQHPDHLLEQDLASTVPRSMVEVVDAIQLVPQEGETKRGAASRSSRATDLEGNRGGGPASQIMEEIVKVFYLSEGQVERRLPVDFQFSVYAGTPWRVRTSTREAWYPEPS